MFERDLEIMPGPELARLIGTTDIDPLDDEDTLTFLRACRRQQAWTEALLLTATAHFAQRRDTVDGRPVPGAEQLVGMGGTETPRCGSFTPDELGPELRMSRRAAQQLIADALDLTFRLPRLLAAVRAGATDAYRARMVASYTRDYSAETTADVETALVHRMDRLTRSDIARTVDKVAARVEPELREEQAADLAESRHVTLEHSRQDHIDVYARMHAGSALRLDARVDQVADMLAALHPEHDESKDRRRARALGLLADPTAVLALAERYRALKIGISWDAPTSTGSCDPLPATTLYVHVRPDDTADLERYGVLALPSVKGLLEDCQVTVKPVIDLAHLAPSSGYRPSDSLREGIILTNPRCPFPYCDFDARKSQQDHTIPYPRGQTTADNLGPPCPRHHNVKTHGTWQLKQPFRGIFVWRSPTGRIYATDGKETLPLAA